MSERAKMHLITLVVGSAIVEALTLLFIHLGWYG